MSVTKERKNATCSFSCYSCVDRWTFLNESFKHRQLSNRSVYQFSLTDFGSTRDIVFRHYPKVPHDGIVCTGR